MRQYLTLPFLFVIFICQAGTSPTFDNSKNEHKEQNLRTKKIKKSMGISINVYRLAKAEKLDDIKDLDGNIAKTIDTKVDLYKMTENLAIILLNSTEPYKDHNSIPYKMLFGRQIYKSISIGDVGGFLPSSEILEITKWIKKNNISTYAGFSVMYDNLSKEVKQLLDDIGTDEKAFIFNAYVRPLAVLYFTALENHNSVLFVGQ